LNLGNPVETSVADLARLVIELTGSRSKLTRGPLPVDDPIQRCPDITEAETLLDWQPKTPLRAGLRRTIAYFEELLTRYGAVGKARVTA
jgi:UDP-glucuronate decarboxylase